MDPALACHLYASRILRASVLPLLFAAAPSTVSGQSPAPPAGAPPAPAPVGILASRPLTGALFTPAAAALPSRREVFFGAAHGAVETPVIGRAALDSAPRRGPFVVEEYEGTSVVPPDCTARIDAFGNVIIALP